MNLRRLKEYKLKPALKLVRDGKLLFLLGVLLEKVIGRNPHLWYLRRFRGGTTVELEIDGHRMLLDMSDKGISRRLYIRGVHEVESSRVFLSELREISSVTSGSVNVIEVGANIGYYVLKEAEVVDGRARIHAFEPSPSNRRLLERNVEMNGYSDMVEVVPKAVGDRNGKTTLAVSEQSNWNTVEADDTERDDIVGVIEVEMTTLGSYLDEQGIQSNSVNAIRMDIEGYETEVVPTLKDILKSSENIVLFIEIHPDDIGESEVDSLISIFEDRGFRLLHASQHRRDINVTSLSQLSDVGGSHIRMVLSKR